jgi:hypothetical protein
VFVSGIQGITQTTYTASWKLEYSLPFSPEKYTDVAFQLNENQYPIGRFKGRYTPIDNKHPFFKRLPESAFIALKEMSNDTAQIIYACKENGQISVYEHNPRKDIKEAKTLKNIVLQNNQTAELPKNTEFTWQFEEFVQNNISHTNLFIIINQKPYKLGIYEGKCTLLDTKEHKKHGLSDNIHTAIQVKETIIAVTLSEKECIVYEKQPDQNLKIIKTLTL